MTLRQPPFSEGKPDDFGPRFQAQLFAGAGPIGFDGLAADGHEIRDLLGGVAPYYYGNVALGPKLPRQITVSGIPGHRG